jgi:multisubunit Na+/H+ antiporter MnhE subunit
MKPRTAWLLRHLLLFAVLLAFWQLLSGRLDPLFISIGVVSSAVITVASGRGIERTIGSAASTRGCGSSSSSPTRGGC